MDSNDEDNDENTVSTWAQVNNGLTVQAVLSMAIDRFDAKRVYAGTLNGIFRTTDAGESWTNITHSLSSTYIYAIITHPDYSGHVLIGTKSSGVFLSTAGGESWQSIWNQNIKKQIHSLAVQDSTIFAGTSSGVYKSLNYGKKWTFCSQGGKTLAINIDVQNPDIIYESANFYGNFISNDGGDSWTSINNGILSGAGWIDTAERFVFHPHQPQHLFMCSSVGLIYRTQDRGSIWARALYPSSETVKYVSIDFAGDILYAATEQNGIYKSTDLGLNWTQVGNKIDTVKNTALRARIAGDNIYIYVGTLENGIYRYVDKR